MSWEKPQITGESPDGELYYELDGEECEFRKYPAMTSLAPPHIDLRFPDGTVLHHIPLKIDKRVTVVVNMHGTDIELPFENVEMRWSDEVEFHAPISFAITAV